MSPLGGGSGAIHMLTNDEKRGAGQKGPFKRVTQCKYGPSQIPVLIELHFCPATTRLNTMLNDIMGEICITVAQMELNDIMGEICITVAQMEPDNFFEHALREFK